MWQYEKKLQYPVKIANPNPALAKVIISQLGGADFKKLYTRHTNAKKATLKASGWHFTTLKKTHNLNRRNNYYFLYIYANQDCYIYNRYHQ